MKLNIYWPVFKNIEKEFEDLLYHIHLDDNQLKVYSSKITDLLLRTCSEIESLSKELFIKNGGILPEKGYLNFDNAIKYLNTLWNIEKKSIIVSSYNCFINDRVIKPFTKNTKRTDTERMTYNWNNAYQNLKHNRYESIHFGNLKNLLYGLSALFILNIYYKDENFHLGDDSHLSKFDLSLGSSLFSISFHEEPSFTHKSEYLKGINFKESIYLVIPDQFLYGRLKEVLTKINSKRTERITQAMINSVSQTKDLNKAIESIKKEFTDNYTVFNKYQLPAIKENAIELHKRTLEMKYHLELNKNQI